LTPQEAGRQRDAERADASRGNARNVEVDADEQMLLAGDALLLCSDGLSRMVTDPEIASTILTRRRHRTRRTGSSIWPMKMAASTTSSVIVLRILAKPEGVLERLKIWKRNTG